MKLLKFKIPKLPKLPSLPVIDREGKLFTGQIIGFASSLVGIAGLWSVYGALLVGGIVVIAAIERQP